MKSKIKAYFDAGFWTLDMVKNAVKKGKITKAEILAQCPDISQTTIQRALNDLVKSGEIIKIGGGRYTSYTWNREID